MLKYFKPKNGESTEPIDRTEKSFNKKLPRLHINPYVKKYKMDSLEVEVFQELDYQCRCYSPLITSFQEFASFMCRTEKSVKRAMEQLEKYGLISMESFKSGKGIYVKVYLLKDLRKIGDDELYGEATKHEHRVASVRTRKLAKTFDGPEEEKISSKEVNDESIDNPPITSTPDGRLIDPTTGELITDKSKAVYNGFQI